MKQIKESKKYNKDLDRIEKQGKDLTKLFDVIENIFFNITLAKKYKDHQLKGEMKDFRECHISPDWLLLYINTNESLYLVRTGSHSEIF